MGSLFRDRGAIFRMGILSDMGITTKVLLKDPRPTGYTRDIDSSSHGYCEGLLLFLAVVSPHPQKS